MNAETPDRDQALAALREVERRQADVRAADRTGGRIMLGWALTLVVTMSLFDFLPTSAAGLALGAVAGSGAGLTALYASRSRVVSRGGLRRYLLTWVAWTAWYGLWIAVLVIRGPHLHFPNWTISGILAALPLAIAGLRNGVR
jgi:hypothetical protein